MAVVKPFRAVRYAHPSSEVTAPPYDVISSAERARLLTRDPHNVVRLTLPESEEQGGETYRRWLDEGILVEDERAAFWFLSQEYVGPDGVARKREGIVGSLEVEPYETKAVLPHERTHAGPKEGRLRLLRAARAQLEPIFLLYDGARPDVGRLGAPDLVAEGTSLWRIEDAGIGEGLTDRQLLIADGHHRYETALAYHEEVRTPESGRMLVVLVSTEDPGLEIFPTHRVFGTERRLEGEREPVASAEEGLARLGELPHDPPALVEVTRAGAAIVRGEPGKLDVEVVDALGHDGIAYTPDAAEAIRRVREGEVAVAFLMRPTRIEDVFAVARRGEVMPQKSTYFFPKLLSGLLFHPL